VRTAPHPPAPGAAHRFGRRLSRNARDDRSTGANGGTGKVVVPGDKYEVGVLHAERGRQVHGVIAAQGVGLGDLAGLLCEPPIDADDPPGRAGPLEVLHGDPPRTLIDPARALGGRERRARLGIHEPTPDARRRPRPQLVGDRRALLVDERLDQRRRVEVDDQRRCSATRSATGAVGLGRPRFRGRQSRCGSWTSPRSRRSASGSATDAGVSRAHPPPEAGHASLRSACAARSSAIRLNATPSAITRPDTRGCRRRQPEGGGLPPGAGAATASDTRSKRGPGDLDRRAVHSWGPARFPHGGAHRAPRASTHRRPEERR